MRPALRFLRPLEHWAIPEVQVLAVLVALVKLHSVVNLQVGPGFWSYCAMTLALLVAQNSSEFDTDPPGAPAGKPAQVAA
jgi:paraquat-inducible protein A